MSTHKKDVVIIGLAMMLVVLLVNPIFAQYESSLKMRFDSSVSLSEAKILNSEAATFCLIKQLDDKPTENEIFSNEAAGIFSMDGGILSINRRDILRKLVYSSDSSYDNKIPVNIGNLTYMLEMKKETDQISLDRGNNPVIGIGSRLRFDPKNWVVFFGKKYRNGEVYITKTGLQFSEGTEQAEIERTASVTSSVEPTVPVLVTTTLAPANISEIINDSALLKLLVLDLSNNLCGIGWSDREREGAGKDKLIKEAKKISAKYGFDVMKTDLRSDVMEGGGFNLEGYVKFSDSWFEVVNFKNSGRLPITEFKSGQITLIPKDLKVYFADKTECRINGKEYVHQGGKWFQK
jgi:hypothetical protein